MRLLRILLSAVVVAAACGPAHAGISLVVEQPDAGSLDLVIRWESDGPGPFTLLRREVPDHGRAASVLPLDRVADVSRTGLVGGRAILANEAEFAPTSDLHVYQLVDQSNGSCSNVGYAALRRAFTAGRTVLVSLPRRSTIHSLGQALDAWPAASIARLHQPEACRVATLQVLPDGTRRGIDEWIPPGRGIELVLSATASLVVAGASDWRDPSTSVTCTAWPCSSIADDLVSLPWGIDWPEGDDVLCADTTDANGDGRPDACAGRFFDGTHDASDGSAPRHGLDPFESRTVGIRLRSLRFSGADLRLDPATGHVLGSTGRSPGTCVLPTPDLGATAACRCADSDGDGDDDCTERLFGTDPANPASRGPDADADGILDAGDDCPLVSNPSQADGDGDGMGDACDPDPSDPANRAEDADADGLLDAYDDCPDVPNPMQEDADLDGFGDACDTCPAQAGSQVDTDSDGRGDLCDVCPLDPVPDTDGDLICGDDNCPDVSNGAQDDHDHDGFGDACDCADQPTRPDPLVLRVAPIAGSALFARELTWNAALPGDLYDVSSGSIADVFGRGDYSTAACLAQGLRSLSFGDGPRNGGVWYLVRARSACSATSWGSGSDPARNPIATLDQGAVASCP